jgi:hypothetical protein
MLRSFDFIKAKIEKHLSSSTLSNICTMTNLTNFTYSRKLKTNIQNVFTRHHMWIKGLMSKGGTIQDVTFDFVVNLNLLCWQSKALAFRS